MINDTVSIPIFVQTDRSFDFVKFQTINISHIISVTFIANSTYNLKVPKQWKMFGCTFQIAFLTENISVKCPHYQIFVKHYNQHGVSVVKRLVSTVSPYFVLNYNQQMDNIKNGR